ncbi:caveolin-2 [Spea bombifrons]|uniref:caveolin-2 n=1 Tax=Spea bombifrons TaxID=233779 RepID=UPI00234AFDC8|nr:caveolin-2 [Spea bombifrons]
MGLEKEKADARIFMDEDDFNRSSVPMLTEKNIDNSPNRDPHRLNSHLKIAFEDVIGEPPTTYSFDKVWICSTALFEISKYVIYKILTLVLAIPLAFIAGLLFAILSCLHIWIVMPFVKTWLMVLPSVKAIWKGVTDNLVAPLFSSMGRCFSSVSVQLDHN